jgi:hypothetical protein
MVLEELRSLLPDIPDSASRARYAEAIERITFW